MHRIQVCISAQNRPNGITGCPKWFESKYSNALACSSVSFLFLHLHICRLLKHRALHRWFDLGLILMFGSAQQEASFPRNPMRPRGKTARDQSRNAGQDANQDETKGRTKGSDGASRGVN